VRRRAERAAPDASVPRVDRLDRDGFHAAAKRGIPLVIAGVVSRWPLAALTPAALGERFGHLRVRARVDDYVETAFSPEKKTAEMSLGEYLRLGRAVSEGLPPYLANQRLPQLDELCEWPAYYEQYRDARVWLGPAGTVTPLHCDYTDNLFAQVWGSKRFRLFPPHHERFLYTWQAGPVLFGSRFDPEAPDYEALPAARQAEEVQCVLEPGELLFLPSGWFHHVRALELSLSVNRWADDYPLALRR